MRHRRFLLLLALFVAGVLAQGWALPVMEGSDESVHTTYIEHLRRTGTLPDRATFRTNSTRQESGQPPLTYWLAAQIAAALQLPATDDQQLFDHLQAVRNTWLTPPDAWNRRDNLNHYLHGNDERAFDAPDVVTTNRVLRFTSLAYGVLAVVAAYGAAREVFRRESWALTATAVFAFMPTFIHVTSYVTNDIPAIAFSTLAVWQALRLLRLGASPARLLGLGVILAAGALSKVSVLLVAPGVGVALLFDWRNRGYGIGRLVLNGVLLGLPLALLFGPWVLWGYATYNDPFGFMTHYHHTLSYETMLPFSRVLELMPEIYLSYWAKFGLAKVYLDPMTYTAMGGLLALAVVGYVVGLTSRSESHVTKATSPPNPHASGLRLRSRVRDPFASTSTQRRWRGGANTLAVQRAVVLGVVVLVVFAGLVRWMQDIAIITGRLMYPAHVVIAIGLTGGLYALTRRFPRLTRSLQPFTVGLMAVSGVVLSSVAMYHAYAEPRMLARDELPALTGGAFTFDDTIRLLGMTQESNVLRGNMHTISLCWEVLQATERPAAFSIKLVKDGVIVADRTSYHGLGHFPSALWQPGDMFCDAIDLPYDDPDVPDDPLPQPGTTYDVLVVMLDAKTFDVNWQATASDGTPVQFPVVGQVRAVSD